MRKQVIALAALAGVASSSVAFGGLVTVRSLDRQALEAMTGSSSMLGFGQAQSGFGSGMGSDGLTGGSLARTDVIRFTLSALSNGSTQFTMIDPSGVHHTLSGMVASERDAISLEVLGGTTGDFSFTLRELSVDGRLVSALDTLDFGAASRLTNGSALLLDGLDFSAGFEVSGVLEIESMRDSSVEDLTQRTAPTLMLNAITFLPGNNPTAAPLPTGGMLALTGLAGLSLLRRRR